MPSNQNVTAQAILHSLQMEAEALASQVQRGIVNKDDAFDKLVTDIFDSYRATR